MNLSHVSIHKPIFTIVLSLFLVIIGIVGFLQLGIREYPEVDPPIITVTTVYRGANAEIIQAQITEVLEESISGIDCIRVLSSVSAEQSSMITVEFNLGTDIETAANDVRDRVSKAQRYLPKDIDPPIVEKMSANANPIIVLCIESDTKNILEVNDIVDKVVKERIQTIEGVAAVRFFGEKKFAMRLWLDPYKMAANRITSADIQRTVERENLELPSGRIEGDRTELSVRTVGLLHTPEQFDNLIIKESNGTIIRLSDVGHAEIGAENERTTAKKDLRPVIVIGILSQQGANSIAIASELYKRLEEIKQEVPDDYRVEVAFDFTQFEKHAVSEVQHTIVFTLVLVVLVIFFFIRDWRSTLIPVIAIPISIIGVGIIMAVGNLTINVLTLLGIVLAIGLVCDDAIVVLENIYTKIDLGLNSLEAAQKGIGEIFFAVISTTITLAAVFLPIMFLPGLTGRLFREFAVVVAGSVMISAFVALTLSPMMCSRLLTRQRHLNMNLMFRITEPFFLALNRGYRYSLKAFMDRRWLVFPILALIVVIIYVLAQNIHSELAPNEDRSVIRVPALAPEGASYEFTEKYMDELAKYVADAVPEAKYTFSMIAPSLVTIEPVNRGMLFIFLKEPGERKRTQEEIFRQVSKDLFSITGVRTFPFQPPTIGDRLSGQPIQFVLQAPSLGELQQVLPSFLAEARKSNILQFVDANLKVNKPELRVNIDREKASQLGVSTFDIAKTLQLTISGERYGYFIMNGKQYEIIGQVMRQDRNEPYNLSSLYVRNVQGQIIQLDNLVRIEESISPSAVFTFNRYLSATVSAGLTPGYTMGDGLNEMNAIAQKVLPKNFKVSYAGQSKDFMESSSNLLYIFLLSIIFIFLVLAAQFESFVDPFIILFTVPLAIAGALFSLWYFNQSLNVFSEIGIIMLIGLVTKNGILIVEFGNQRKHGGLMKIEAIQQAAISRLRPILMTSFTMILGILPVALSLGASAKSRQSLGIAVVGGLIFSTFLTLYIIPALYSYFSKEIIVVKKENNQLFRRDSS
ncbi:efflux RND transporter permease subunit [candidate division KSB1 bacterium]|nr:efflux RND transporter permease subunit [candidate division KSB1 bacterium]